MHCIPFAFSKCFMHLDVCLYVENCVLIDLDWVKPMMQFFFTYHMFMHFSCIVPFLFYLLVLYCDGAFLFVSLTLSLSLSLFDSLHMAPKHKSASSWNPLRFGASSSDPTLFHVRFLDEKA